MLTKVKTENRLPESYYHRLAEAGISRMAVADASPAYHPRGYRVSAQFITRVVKRQDACPDWLREQLDAMLAESERERG